MVIHGADLPLEGAGLLVLDRLGASLPLTSSDVRHNLLHVVWGVALLGVSFLARGGHDIRAVWAAVIFGAFYVALGVLGLTIDHPFGLQLGPGENAFHFTVGPLALVLGAWALRATMAPVPSRTAVRQAEFRTGPAIPLRMRGESYCLRVCSTPAIYGIVPPMTFGIRLTRAATSASKPKPATFTKYLVDREVWISPRSIGRATPVAASAAAAAGSCGIPRLCERSLAVPTGMIPSGVWECARPLATSHTVPSPPTAITRS